MEKTALAKRTGPRVWAGLFMLVLCAAAMIAGSFWDYQISSALYDPGPFFGEFFNRVGETPAYLFLPFAAMIFFHAWPERIKKSVPLRILWHLVFGALACLAFYYVLSDRIADKWIIDDEYRSGFMLVLSLCAAGLSLWLSSYIPRYALRPLAKFSIFALIAAVITTFAVDFLKELGRTRIRDLASEADFRPWYAFGGKGKSFPSGQVASAAALFILTGLPSAFPRLRRAEPWIFLFALLFTMATALSRTILSAHYLTDTTASAAIVYFFLLGLRRPFYPPPKE